MKTSCRKGLATCQVQLLESLNLMKVCISESYAALENMSPLVRGAAKGEELEEKLNCLVDSRIALEESVSNLSKAIG